MPLELVARRGGNGRREATELSRYARRELAALLDRWNAEDAACGRNVAAGIMEKMERRWKACDL